MYAQELQGTLLVTLRNSNQIIDDGEVRRFPFEGEIRVLTQFLSSQRYVEFYDTRVSCVFCDRRKIELMVG